MVGLAAIAVELRFADFDHGTHLLVLLAVVIGLSVIGGPGPGALGLLVGGAGAGVTSIGTREPASHPDTVLQLAMYLVTGLAFIAVVSVTAEARRRRLLIGAPNRPERAVPIATLDRLTEREREVLRFAATGASVHDMARALYVSSNTVKTHLTHVYAKLGARGRSDAIRRAVHLGYLDSDDICPHVSTLQMDGSDNAT